MNSETVIPAKWAFYCVAAVLVVVLILTNGRKRRRDREEFLSAWGTVGDSIFKALSR